MSERFRRRQNQENRTPVQKFRFYLVGLKARVIHFLRDDPFRNKFFWIWVAGICVVLFIVGSIVTAPKAEKKPINSRGSYQDSPGNELPGEGANEP